MRRTISKFFIIIAIIVISMIAIVHLKNKNKTIVDEFVQAVKTKDMQTMKQLFQVDEVDKKNNVDALSLNNFVQYLYENDNKLKTIEKSLYDQIDTGKPDSKAIVQLHTMEKKLGLYRNYQLKLKNSYIKIESVAGDLLDVTLDSAIFLNKHKEDHVYGPIFPGDHRLQMEYENELGIYHIQEEITVWDKESHIIKVNLENILKSDEKIKQTIFEQSVNYSLQLIEFMDDTDDGGLLFDEWDIFAKDDELSWKMLTDDKPYKFSHAIFDSESYDIMYIEDEWYASARIISTFERESKGAEHLLFEFNFFYSELFDEWLLTDYVWDETDESVINLWDETERLERDELIDNNVL